MAAGARPRPPPKIKPSPSTHPPPTCHLQASDNYPEVMEKTYICYAPWVFQKVWGFVSPMLDPRTAAKFVIMGGPNEFLPRLTEHLDIEELPEFLGGKDKSCNFVDEVGPWAQYVPDIK